MTLTSTPVGPTTASMLTASSVLTSAHAHYVPEPPADQLVDRLRRAIDRNDLDVAFQPTVELRAGVVTGFEALARWNDDVFGEVSPTTFIPLAEQHGLIGDLGALVRRRAVEALLTRRRRSHGVQPVQLWVNVSPLELEDARRVDEILDLAARQPSVRLGVEITEQSEIAIVRLSDALERLTRSGVSLALDDFGSGVAAYSLLPHLPLSVLKLDRGLVGEIAYDRRSLVVVEHLVGLAHQLGFAVTAEGVEQLDQYQALRDLGCDQCQGFLTGSPLPAHRAFSSASVSRAA